ncbi:MAG: Fic family protein [Bacteroidetes bacterium]|nr:MAG: Fic family protein [Bacteroidota bacterium]
MSFSATHPFELPELPPQIKYDEKSFTKWLLKIRTELGELKGYSFALPNPMLLLSPAIIKESVASSEIENINTTVEKVLEQQLFPEGEQKMENKEVLHYKNAIIGGFEQMKNVPLGNRLILGIHKQLLHERSYGYRKTQNRIENSVTNEVLYTPPSANDIHRLIGNWEKYVHDSDDEVDPLIKCAIAHYQFEAIHPFGDGNGRTGRILMVLYLVHVRLLHYPILYLSGYINRNRSKYYKLLRGITTKNNWNDFIEYMLKGFYLQAKETKEQLFKVMELLTVYREKIKKDCPNIYSADLVEILFSFPIITPVRLGSLLNIHYTTATRYLKQLNEKKFLEHRQVGKYQLYINKKLMSILKG